MGWWRPWCCARIGLRKEEKEEVVVRETTTVAEGEEVADKMVKCLLELT